MLVSVSKKDVVRINKDQTYLAISPKCEEVFCIGLTDEKKLLMRTYYNKYNQNLDSIKKNLIDREFPENFVEMNIEKDGCAYFIPYCSQDGYACAVYESSNSGDWDLVRRDVKVIDWDFRKLDREF